MDIKFSNFTSGAANILKNDGSLDRLASHVAKPMENAADKFVNTANEGLIRTPGKKSFLASIINAPIKAIANKYQYFLHGTNAKGKDNIFRKIAMTLTNSFVKNNEAKEQILKNAGKIPFIGTAIVLGGMLWGIGKTVHTFVTQDLTSTSYEFLRTVIKTTCAALGAAGLTATGAGAVVSGAGAAAGLAVGEKISDKLFGVNNKNVTDKDPETAKNPEVTTNKVGLPPVNNAQDVILNTGYPVSGGQMNDEKFNQLLNYTNAVAHY